MGEEKQQAEDAVNPEGTEDDAEGHAPIHRRLDAEGTDDAEGHRRT